MCIRDRARGIDGAAQRGALNGGGRTYGVLGCGVDICYPREHRGLYCDISVSYTHLDVYKRQVVKHGQSINLGQFRIEFIKTNHSIPVSYTHLLW